jgi:hypothetical protein
MHMPCGRIITWSATRGSFSDWKDFMALTLSGPMESLKALPQGKSECASSVEGTGFSLGEIFFTKK